MGTVDRRRFLKGAAVGGAAVALTSATPAGAQDGRARPGLRGPSPYLRSAAQHAADEPGSTVRSRRSAWS